MKTQSNIIFTAYRDDRFDAVDDEQKVARGSGYDGDIPEDLLDDGNNGYDSELEQHDEENEEEELVDKMGNTILSKPSR